MSLNITNKQYLSQLHSAFHTLGTIGNNSFVCQILISQEQEQKEQHLGSTNNIPCTLHLYYLSLHAWFIIARVSLDYSYDNVQQLICVGVLTF